MASNNRRVQSGWASRDSMKSKPKHESHPTKKLNLNKQEKAVFLNKLKELFEPTFDDEIIQSVANASHWKVEQAVEKLIELSGGSNIKDPSRFHKHPVGASKKGPEKILAKYSSVLSSTSTGDNVKKDALRKSPHLTKPVTLKVTKPKRLPHKSPVVPVLANDRWLDRFVGERHYKLPETMNGPQLSDKYLSSGIRHSQESSSIKILYKGNDNGNTLYNNVDDEDADVVVEEENEYDISEISSSILSPFLDIEGNRCSMFNLHTGNPLQRRHELTTPTSNMIDRFHHPKTYLQASSGSPNHTPSSTLHILHTAEPLAKGTLTEKNLKSVKNKNKDSSVSLTLDKLKSSIKVQKGGSKFDFICNCILQKIKIVVLMRGCPGSGKTHLAKNIIKSTIGGKFDDFVFSTDDFFTLMGQGKYLFVPGRLPEAHAWNQQRVLNQMQKGISPIIVDNTNLQVWEMRPYAAMGVKFGYIIELLEPETPWRYKAGELAVKNTHGVSKKHILTMLERFETTLSPQELLSMFNLKYSIENRPPQPAYQEVTSKVLKKKRPRNKKKQKCVSENIQIEDSLKNILKSEYSGNNVSQNMTNMQQSVKITDYLCSDLQNSSSCEESSGENSDSDSKEKCNERADSNCDNSDVYDDDQNTVKDNPSVMNKACLHYVSSSENKSWSRLLGNESNTLEYVLIKGTEIIFQKDHDLSEWLLSDCENMSSFVNNTECNSANPHFIGKSLKTCYNSCKGEQLEATMIHFEETCDSVKETNSFIPFKTDLQHFHSDYNESESNTTADNAELMDQAIPIGGDVVMNVSFISEINKGNISVASKVEDPAFNSQSDRCELSNQTGICSWESAIANSIVELIIDRVITQCTSAPQSTALDQPSKAKVTDKDFTESTIYNGIKTQMNSLNISNTTKKLDSSVKANIQLQNRENLMKKNVVYLPLNMKIPHNNPLIAGGDDDDDDKLDFNNLENIFANVLTPSIEIAEKSLCNSTSNQNDENLIVSENLWKWDEKATGKEDSACNSDVEEWEDLFQTNPKIDLESSPVLINLNMPETIEQSAGTSVCESFESKQLSSFVQIEQIAHDNTKNCSTNWEETPWDDDDYCSASEGNHEASIPKPARSNKDRLILDRQRDKIVLPENTREEISKEVEIWDSVADPLKSWKGQECVDLKSLEPKSSEPLTRSEPQNGDGANTDEDNSQKTSLVDGIKAIFSGNNTIEEENCFDRALFPNQASLTNTTESSTNTLISDFALLFKTNSSSEICSSSGFIVVTANNRDIGEGLGTKIDAALPRHNVKLDKSTMTSPDNIEAEIDVLRRQQDFEQLCDMFSEVSVDGLQEIFEKCHCDINWCVEILLSSVLMKNDHPDKEDSKKPLTENPNYDMKLGKKEFKLHSHATNIDRENDNQASTENSETKIFTRKPNRKDRKNISEESLELKRLVERNIVIDESCYSEHVQRIRKIRYGELLDMGEVVSNTPSRSESWTDLREIDSVSTEKDALSSQDNPQFDTAGDSCTVRRPTAHDIEPTEIDYDDEQEEESLTMKIDSEFVDQLQGLFGAIPFFCPKSTYHDVKIPLSLARQIHACLLEAQDQQTEHMVQEDEEFARKLQAEECRNQKCIPGLREIMDMEIAMALYKADKEEWASHTKETLATKLTKQLLCETFPSIPKEILMEVYEAHGNSFYETLDVILSSTGTEESDQTLWSAQAREKCEQELVDRSLKECQHTSQQPAKTTAIDLSHQNLSVESVEYFRDLARRHYELRQECLQKAIESFRRKQYGVASYYSRMATLHKERIAEANEGARQCVVDNQMSVNDTTLNLHFMSVQDALHCLDTFLNIHLKQFKTLSRQQSELYVITGRGNHSAGGISRIKPAVIRRLKQRNVRYVELNPGYLKLLLNRENFSIN